MKPLVVIVGPTASGKSEWAINLAKKQNGEILCADSRTVYRGLDIGTAKPFIGEKSVQKKETSLFGPVYLIDGVAHYLLDIVPPDSLFNVAEFQKLAYQIIDYIHLRQKIPFLVGGSALYVDVVRKGFVIPKVPPNQTLRTKLNRLPNEVLWEKLKKIDPVLASKNNPANKRRIIRALEVFFATKSPISKLQQTQNPPYHILTLGIKIPLPKLYHKIEQRVDKMIKQGLVEEVKELLNKGYSPQLPSMSGVGYRQIAQWLLFLKNHPNLKGKDGLERVIDQIKSETRRLAKYQISWFKRDKKIVWVESEKEAEEEIEKFLNAVASRS